MNKKVRQIDLIVTSPPYGDINTSKGDGFTNFIDKLEMKPNITKSMKHHVQKKRKMSDFKQKYSETNDLVGQRYSNNPDNIGNLKYDNKKVKPASTSWTTE